MQKDIMSYLFQLLTDLYLWFILRVRTESWIHWNFPNNFPDLEKSLEKWWIVLVFFFKIFVFIKSYSISPLRLLFIIKKNFVLFITYLITFSLEKEIIVWKKIWKKVLNFGSKNLYEPCIHVFMLMSRFSAMPEAFCQIRIQFLCLY